MARIGASSGAPAPATPGITALTGDVSASGSGSVAATVNAVGGSSAATVHTAELAANAATAANTASTIVKRDASGNFTAGTITANVTGSSGSFTGTLAGDVTGNQGTTVVAKISGTTVSGTTGTTNVVFSSSPTITGTLSAATISASGNVTGLNLSGTNTGDQTITLTGDVTGSGTGSFSATVASVGGSSASNVHSAELAANAATATDTVSTIVKRDGAGSTHLSSVKLDGATSGVATLTVPATVSSYTLTLPSAQGAAGTFPSNDGSGNLSWTNPITNIDGGSSTSVYVTAQIINGGTA